MKIGIDIDGTICPEYKYRDRDTAEPFPMAVNIINDLYEQGNIIIFFTARGWHEYDYTVRWLILHGFKFHQLICGKPIFDVYVDDRSVQNLNKLQEAAGESIW